MNDDARPRLPELPWHGGCQCGQVRYTLGEFPLMFYACHCTECQKQSASAYGLSVMVRKGAVEISGRLEEWTRPTASGNFLHCRFCPQCGARLFHDWPQPGTADEDRAMNIKGGSLDSAMKHVPPTAHIWVASKQAGTIIPDGVPVFEREPDDKAGLIPAFAAKYGIDR